MRTWLTVFVLAVVLAVGGPAEGKGKGKGKVGQGKGKGYTTGQISKVFDQLAEKGKFAADKRKELKDLMEVVIARKWFKAKTKKRPVGGVFVYYAGEGGFIVKFMNGDGHASFKGGKQQGKVHLKAWSAGAQVGGSASWGVGLVLGLKKVEHFGGEYSGSVKGATAGDAATRGAVVLRKGGKRTHELALITVGRGLSAGVGGAKLTITPDW